MHFRNRRDAGRQLAAALQAFRLAAAIVFPLPRGGVTLGLEIARTLGLPLDLIIPRKIGHPHNPEYAICALAECGQRLCNPLEVSRVDPAWLEAATQREQLEAARRRQAYLPEHPVENLTGKTAILVDDGIATGLTMRAAVRDARYRGAEHIVVAIPVVPADTAALLRREVDTLVALEIPAHYLGSVGAYYDEFNQVSDAEVIELLQLARQLRDGEC